MQFNVSSLNTRNFFPLMEIYLFIFLLSTTSMNHDLVTNIFDIFSFLSTAKTSQIWDKILQIQQQLLQVTSCLIMKKKIL